MNERLIKENTGDSMNEDEQQQHSHIDTNIINDKEVIDEQDFVEDKRRLKNDDDDDHPSDDDDDDDGIIQYAMRKHKSTHNILNKIKLFPMEVSYKNNAGQHPLHDACYYCYNYVAMKLMDAYPEAVRHPDRGGYYPLHTALRGRTSEDVIMKLIAINPEAVCIPTRNGDTALHLACNNWHFNRSETLIRKLIEIYPFAIQVNDCEGKVPIYGAIKYGQVEKIAVIKMLLDGDPLGMQRRYEYEYGYKDTPFHHACTSDDADLVQYMIQRSDLQINARDCCGKTPLHRACYEHQVKNVEILLHHPDVDINASDNSNDTPLHTIVRAHEEYFNDRKRGNVEIHVQIVQKLLEHPFILTNHTMHYDDKTPLDIVRERINQLEKSYPKYPTTSLKIKLKCYIQMDHILQDFQLKRKWQSYVYHFKNF